MIGTTITELPYEIKSEIFNRIPVQDLVAWLKVNPLRDSILDFLTEVSNRHCRLAIYFPLKDVIDGFDYELLNSPEEGIQRHMPHLTPWSTKQPIAWLLSSIRILSKANSFNGDYVISSLTSHTPMHSPRINTNFIFYVRNSKVALWRRETQSGIYIEPHQMITRSQHTSWLCKSEIELTVNEEIFATGIARSDDNGNLDGTVCIKVFSTTTLETMAHWESEFLVSNPSLQIHAVNKFSINGRPVVTVLLSVWDRRWGANENDVKMIDYYIVDSLANQFTLVDQVGHNDAQRHEVYLNNTNYYRVTLSGSYDRHVFGSELSIQCNYKNVTDDWRQLFKRRLFSTPESFGFHPVLGVLWWYDKFQLICYHAASQKCLLKYDLRCKSKVSFHSTERSLLFTMVNSITSSIVLQQLFAECGKVTVVEKEFDMEFDFDQTVFHDSAILFHSEDKCSIQIHDYLRPFLSS